MAAIKIIAAKAVASCSIPVMFQKIQKCILSWLTSLSRSLP
jgi:hypothetical protein